MKFSFIYALYILDRIAVTIPVYAKSLDYTCYARINVCIFKHIYKHE